MKKQWGQAIPNFNGRLWLLLFSYTASLFGSGLTEPFLVVYLHQVRGIEMAMAGSIIAVSGIAGVVTVPAAGWIGDRFGMDRSLILTLAISAVGQAGMAFAQGPNIAFVSSFLTGAGLAGSWNAMSSMLAESVGPTRRNEVFGVAFGLQNVGFGLGSAVGGMILDAGSVLTFQFVFLFDSLTFLSFAFFAGQRPGCGLKKSISQKGADSGKTVGYRTVLRDQALLGSVIFYTVFAVVMTGLVTTAFPQWATGRAHSSTDVVGMAFLANSIVIGGGQIFALRLIGGKLRTRVVSITALLFGVGCTLILLSGSGGGGAWTTLGFIAAFVVIGFGETLLFPALPALVNDLASRPLRGRYNAVFNLSWQAGGIAGPLLAGWALGRRWALDLFLGFIITSGLLALFALLLERIIPKKVNKG